MRTASSVREDWISPYVKLLKQIKTDKIAQQQSHKEVVALAKRERLELQEDERSKARDGKVEGAKERFLKRALLRQKAASAAPGPGSLEQPPTKKLAV